jgi:hypothetical protein
MPERISQENRKIQNKERRTHAERERIPIKRTMRSHVERGTLIAC